jgi:hypothetical protein
VGLLVFLPNLLSTATGQRWLQRSLTTRLPGELDFQEMTLSWRHGLTVEHLRWQDAGNGTRLTIARLQANPRLLSFVKGGMSLGTTVIEQPTIHLAGTRDPVPNPPSGDDDPIKTQPPLPPGPSVSRRWRLKDMQLIVTDGVLHVGDETDLATWRDLNLEIQVPESGSGRIHLRARGPGAVQAGTIDLAAEASRPFDTGSLAGQLQLTLETLDLQSLEPILALFGRSDSLRGEVNGSMNARMDAGRLTQGSVHLQGRELQITGPDLEPDRLVSSATTLSAQLTEQEDRLAVQVELTSEGLEARIDGVCPVADLTAGALLQAPWTGDVRVDLAVWTRQLRHALQLRDGVDVTGGRLEGTLQLAEGWFSGDLRIVDLHGVYGERPLRLSEDVRTNTRFQWAQQGVQIEAFRLQAPFATVDLKGHPAQLDYTLEMDLARLQRELGAFLDLGDLSWAGMLTANASLQQENRQWAWIGSADLRDLRLVDPNGHQVLEPHVQIQHRVAYDLDQEVLTQVLGRLRGSMGTLSMEPVALPSGGVTTCAFRLMGQRLDLARVVPWGTLMGVWDESFRLSGALDLNCALALEDTALHLVTRDLRITDLTVQRGGEPAFTQEQVAGTLRARLDRRGGGIDIEELALDTVPLTLQEGTFQRTVTQGQVTMGGRARCVYDWQAVQPLITAFVPAGLHLRGRRDDIVTFTSTYPEGVDGSRWAGLTADAALGFDHASCQGLEIGPTEVNLSVRQGTLTLAPFVSTVNQGELRFGCRADLSQHPPAITLSEPMQVARDIHITGPLAANLLKYVNPLFANLTEISGRLDFESRELVWPVAADAQDQLKVIGTIAMRDVLLEGSSLLSEILALFNLQPVRGQRLAVRPTAFTVQNGTVRYADMQIDIGDNPLNFSGSIGLDDSLDMLITLPYTWSGRTARVDRPSGDRIQWPLTGTLSEPRLDTERFLKDQLRQQIEKQIHKGLEELFERL